MEEKFEFERDDLRRRLVVLEKKLAERTQDLSLAESTLANRDIEFESLQNSLGELNELREMKEVMKQFVPWMNTNCFFTDKNICKLVCLLELIETFLYLELVVHVQIWQLPR